MASLGRRLLGLQRAFDHATDRRPRVYAEQVQAWAATAGWSYRDRAADLAGRWLAPVNGIEDFRFVAEGPSLGRPVVVATREVYLETRPRDETSMDRRSVIAVRLPGRPPDELLGSPWQTEQAIRAMGGFVPEPYEVHCTPDGWLVATRGGYHELKRLTPRIEMLTGQVARLPADFWRR